MPYPTRSAGSDIPPSLLDLFTLADGRVHWSFTPVARKVAPWGKLAGGKPVLGRGSLVVASRYLVTTADIAFALEHAGEWAWQVGHDVPSATCGEDVARFRALVTERLELRAGEVVWRVDRGRAADGSPQYRAGDIAQGMALSGYRGRMLTTSGVGILLTDIRSVLETGRFAFEAQWD